MDPAALLLHDLKRLRTMADTGLLYADNEFDRERYREQQEMALRMMALVSGNPAEALRASFPPIKDYPTPKVDVRGLLLSADKKQVLLVKESVDGRWALPGGWADVGYSPREMLVKEFREEAGLEVAPVRLLACWDKRLHSHPPEAFYVYKLFFYCEARSEDLAHGHDMLGVAFFGIDSLPPLSLDRNTGAQIQRLYEKAVSGDLQADVD